jgi:hypothetical protein
MTERTFASFNEQWRQGDLFGAVKTVVRRPFNPCKCCRGVHFHLEPGRGPHAAALSCVSCGQFWGWMSKHEFEGATS